MKSTEITTFGCILLVQGDSRHDTAGSISYSRTSVRGGPNIQLSGCKRLFALFDGSCLHFYSFTILSFISSLDVCRVVHADTIEVEESGVSEVISPTVANVVG